MNIGSIISGITGGLKSIGGGIGGFAQNPVGSVTSAVSNWQPVNQTQAITQQALERLLGPIASIFQAPGSSGIGPTTLSAPKSVNAFAVPAQADNLGRNAQGGQATASASYGATSVPMQQPSRSANAASPSAFNSPAPASSQTAGRASVPNVPAMPAQSVVPQGLTPGSSSGGGSSPSPAAVPMALLQALAASRAGGGFETSPESVSTGGAPKRRLSQADLVSRLNR